MATGTTALKELVIAQIAQIDLYGDGLSAFSSWDSVSSHLLKLSLRMKLLDEGDVRTEIYKRLLVVGRQSYEQYMKTKTPPDHTSSPHAFAFAIHNDAFTRVELESIEFDHGETLETFMAGEISDLPEKIFDKLFSFKKPEPDIGTSFPACC